MRVLQINSVCGTGSTGKLAAQISDYLNEMGIENAIAYGMGQTDRPNAYKFGNMLSAHWHSFISRKLCMQGYGSWLSTGRLIRYIKKFAPDVIHLHNIHGHYIHFPRLFRFLQKYDRPVAWTFHDCWPMTGKCAHFTKVGCNKWKTQCMHCPSLDTYPDSTRDRSYRNYQDKRRYFGMPKKLHVVTVSQWLKEIAEESFFKDREVECIYNGIDTRVFRPTESTIRQELGIGDRFMILGIANMWDSRKGFNKFLRLAKRLDPDSVIVLVGISEEKKATMPDNVIGISRTDNQQQLAQLYTAADVLLNYSMEETFGLVVAEALACGTPAIVVNRTACPEVVNPETGIVVEPHDIEQLDGALATIREKGKSAYSAACVERANESFANEIMQKRYAALYGRMEKTRESTIYE